MSILKLFLLQLAVMLSCCDAYKVLVVFPMASKSHGILGDGIVRHLVNDGHEVTYITPYTYKPASPKVRTIDVSDNEKLVQDDVLQLDTILKSKMGMPGYAFVLHIMSEVARSTIQNENVQKLINNPKEQFDVVIVEWMFSDLYSGFAAVFDCPYIWSSAVDAHWGVLRLIDSQPNPAYFGDSMSLVVPPFTFWQRVNELCTQLKIMFMKYVYFDIAEQRVYDTFFAPSIIKRGRQPPSYYDIKYNASLLLTNSHPSLSSAQTIPQNAISIGGYHIEAEVKPLPEDLKKILDNAKNGVIYFSMGSNLKSKFFPNELKDNILKMFGELNQTVLWKFEEDLPNKPKNMHILQWAPQQGILSHPNTVLFITHGGLLSTTETIHFGKPVIGIPVFADQFANVERVVHKGFGLRVDLSYTLAEDMKLAIDEMISNPKYAERAQELSKIYHDRLVPPGKEISHWVKHVIQTRGARHLRSAGFNVPFYQRLYLDLLFVILVTIYVSVRLLKHVYRMVYSESYIKSKKNN